MMPRQLRSEAPRVKDTSKAVESAAEAKEVSARVLRGTRDASTSRARGISTRAGNKQPMVRQLWVLLPPELRGLILDHLLTYEMDERHRLSRYATVCREWQPFFEAVIFKTIKLSQHDIVNFERFIQGLRRLHLQKLWLEIELPRFDCPECMAQVIPRERNNAIYSSAVCRLFEILGSWDDQDGRIELEFSALSQLDSTHWVLHGSMNFPGSMRPLFAEEPLAGGPSRFRWLDGRPEYSCMRADDPLVVRGWGLYLDLHDRLGNYLHQKLSSVPVIDSLLIRRRSRRSFWVDCGLWPLLDALPNLERFRYEPYDDSLDEERLFRRTQYALLLWCALRPKSKLRAVSIYEDSRMTVYEDSVPRSARRPSETVRKVGLQHVLVASSLQWERLYASFIVDAKDFFQAVEHMATQGSPPQWENLETLLLTSDLLTPRTLPDERDRLIRSAAIAAQGMPKLRRMELWYGGRRHGCIFTYFHQRTEDKATITLKTTWLWTLSQRAVADWRGVAHQQKRCEGLEVQYVLLDPKGIRDHRHMLEHLTWDADGPVTMESKIEMSEDSKKLL